ncbi:MAG TPA: tripartite tricarboxylate transporter substrate binding protein [Burkholderiales bacterium]|nr:tripartite tricarboxylate transporter substrate binding protein [Burkholderiales bacterium]
MFARNNLLWAGALAGACYCYCGSALAQRTEDAARAYPSRPVRLVIGFTPGGQPDIVARLIAPALSSALGQQWVIDNRPGAGGITGTKIVTDAQPDGYTLLGSSSAIAITPAVFAKLPFDTQKDIAGVATAYSAAYLLAVTPSLNVRSVQDFVAYAKARPGQLNFSSAGNGSGTHFAGEIFKQATQIDVVHVPYKGIPEALTDTIGGRAHFTMAPLGSALNLVREGRLRGLAVTSAKRLAVYPDLPTVAESGYPGFRWDSWGGIFAPARTPRAVVNKLNHEIVRALTDADIQQRMSTLGMEATPSSPEQLDKFLAEQIALVMQLAKKAGLQAR